MVKLEGWANTVAQNLGLKNPLDYQSHEGGRVTIHLECSTCPKIRDVSFPKRYPPNVLRKKLLELGWDLRKKGKGRCPTCVSHGNTGTIKQIKNTENTVEDTIKVTRGKNQTSLTISPKDDLFKTFVEDGSPSAYWSMEYVIDRTGTPQLIVSRQAPPSDGKTREKGKARGSMHPSGNYMLQCANGATKGVEKVIEFGTLSAQLENQQGRHIILNLPNGVKAAERIPTKFTPTSPSQVKESIPAPPPPPPTPPVTKPAAEQKAEVIEETKPETKPAPAPKPVEENWHQPVKKNNLEPSPFMNKHSIGLVYAVKMVNHYKQIMGDDLDLTIDENGRLNAMAAIS